MDATRGRVFVDQSDRRTEDILSAMENFGAKIDRPNGATNAVKTHPLLTSPSPTDPVGLPLLPGSASSQQPQTAKVTQKDPMNHPLHHPPPNAWNSPKHQTKLSQLMGTASSSHQSASTGSSNKVHPSDRKTSTHSSSHSTATARVSSSVSAAAARGSLNTPSSSTHEALHEAEYFNAKLGTSFCDEFERLFTSPRPWTALRDHAINSRLRNCRSVPVQN